MPRGRPIDSRLCQVEAYLGDMDVTGLASCWAMARLWPKQCLHTVDALLCENLHQPLMASNYQLGYRTMKHASAKESIETLEYWTLSHVIAESKK